MAGMCTTPLLRTRWSSIDLDLTRRLSHRKRQLLVQAAEVDDLLGYGSYFVEISRHGLRPCPHSYNAIATMSLRRLG